MVSKLNAVGKEGTAKPTVGTIYKEIGFGGLWAGLGTRIVMIGTLTALQWCVVGVTLRSVETVDENSETDTLLT